MMRKSKTHKKKKKTLIYFAFVLLLVFLVNVYHSEIGSVLHVISHALNGTEYSHVHNHTEESYNQISPHKYNTGQNHSHKLLSFLHLLDKPGAMPFHSDQENLIRLKVSEYATINSACQAIEIEGTVYDAAKKECWYNPIPPDILTPPPQELA